MYNHQRQHFGVNTLKMFSKIILKSSFWDQCQKQFSYVFLEQKYIWEFKYLLRIITKKKKTYTFKKSSLMFSMF